MHVTVNRPVHLAVNRAMQVTDRRAMLSIGPGLRGIGKPGAGYDEKR